MARQGEDAEEMDVEPSLLLFLFAHGWALSLEHVALPSEVYPYTRDAYALLHEIDMERIPAALADLFMSMSSGHQLYQQGCVCIEVRNYISTQPGAMPEVRRVVLHPHEPAIINELAYLRAANGEPPLSDREWIHVESTILNATGAPVCLNPSTQVFTLSAAMHYNRTKHCLTVDKRCVSRVSLAHVDSPPDDDQSSAGEHRLSDFVERYKSRLRPEAHVPRFPCSSLRTEVESIHVIPQPPSAMPKMPPIVPAAEQECLRVMRFEPTPMAGVDGAAFARHDEDVNLAARPAQEHLAHERNIVEVRASTVAGSWEVCVRSDSEHAFDAQLVSTCGSMDEAMALCGQIKHVFCTKERRRLITDHQRPVSSEHPRSSDDTGSSESWPSQEAAPFWLQLESADASVS